MSPETFRWLLALHVFAVLAWTGTLGAGLHSLLVHSDTPPEGRSGLERLEWRVAIAMNASGAVAIALGLTLLLSTQGLAHLSNGLYMYAKLAAVFGLLGIHAFAQVKIRQFRAGDVGWFPPWMIGIAYGLMLVIVIAVVVQPTAAS